MEQTTLRFSVPRTGGSLARRTTVGVVVALVGVLLSQTLVDALAVDVGASGPASPFAAVPLVATTIAAGIGAAVVYGALITVTDRPVRNFLVVAVAVFAVMLVPVVSVTPSMGVTPTGQGVLVLYHVVVAVPIVAFVAGAIGNRRVGSDSTDVAD
ncbi:hypothetical protein GJ629_00570 [Halapricum sp. CBA1109]|uniref:DUF6069 family protein n=1 Tax=Halapricum sp. CBA1109 TaxID=2668068 RepID=UPI0012F9AC89|nr:DUF6069 family protein [Halapricum sp. CBA1109]MUV88563.1 hypothetical protein [Halapricum sp. CBA1109]